MVAIPSTGAAAAPTGLYAPSPGRRPVYVSSEVYRRAAFGGNHPLNAIRHSNVVDLCRCLGWLPDGVLRNAEPAPVAKLLRFHDRAYVDAVQHAGRVTGEVRERFALGTLENPLFPGLFERAATTVGGSILAARLALENGVAFHPSGGTHHGRRDRASGFCYFNDPVFAILTLLDAGCERVLYVDLDAHHGDGVEDAFAAETRVMTVSIHEENRWPYSGAADERRGGGARNLPVPAGLNDSELDVLIDDAVLPIAGQFAPAALVICCGADALAGDPLSGMRLSNRALWDGIARLLALDRPAVVLGGGGYNPWTLTRYWTGLWGRLAGLDLPGQLPAPAQALLHSMSCDLVDEEDINPAWLTTLVDPRNDGPVRPAIGQLTAAARRP
ncbi:MAG: acetoin utilization protein AcuC [Gammaproteobacteria bacterium]|nr:acetoin utilization protein AcuC [Gammaproteobacteria bacterium]